MRRSWFAGCAWTLVFALLSGCSSEVVDEPISSTREPLINADQYLYLRCNSTDWNVSEKSRLQSTQSPGVFQLTISVTQPWTQSDQCIFTLVSASSPDSWGNGQSNFTDSNPSTSLAVPGGDSMVGPQSAQTNFGVHFPSLGVYRATVDWAARTFTLGQADGGGGVDASADAPPEARADSGADARLDGTVGDDGAPEARADSGADARLDGTDASRDGTLEAESGTDAGAVADAQSGLDAPVDHSDASGYLPPTGGYTVQCPWLLDASTMVTHLLGSADFYSKVADPQFGGFFTYLDQKGNPKSTNKSFQVQSRDAYAFAHAFMVSGNESYLTAARQALDFLYAHASDPVNGGYVFLGDQRGNWLPAPSGVPSDKWSFTQHYALAGPTAMCEATRNETDCGAMNAGMQLLEAHYADPTQGGYYNNANLDFSQVSEKGFTPTIDGITPHILLTYLVTGDASVRARFVSLADDAVNHLVGSMKAPGVVFGYPEFFNADWSIETGNTYGFVGHLYKTAWALARAYLVTGDARYRAAARSVVMQLWNAGGFDHANGAPNFDYNFNSGVGSTNKEYWQVEQGFTSGITSWYIAATDADRAVYIEQADRSLCFFMRHFPDVQNGGIFFETNTDGTSLVNDGSDSATDKGDQWEGSYHNAELSYYAYVYGNLLLWRRPVTLYYRFAAGPQERTVTLDPLEIEPNALAISGVRLTGQAYTDFNGAARTLHLPAGTGGVFAVTYAHAP